jgi:stearoyl-CoA desaturase (delta-9 desaturase)
MGLQITNGRATALYYTAAVATLFAIPLATPYWVAAALVIHVLVISIFSGVTHRYFCHKTYNTNETLAWALSSIPVAYGYASPLSWSYIHTAHHAFSDTEDDPHVAGWKGLLTASYRRPKSSLRKAANGFMSRRHLFIHHNALAIMAALGLCLLTISPAAFLWLFAVPLFTLKLGDGLHRALSHANGKAQNRWYLEYIVPMGGEWIHEEHHANASKPIYRNKWYELDTGGILIRAIAK